MPHADALALPSEVTTKAQFYEHVTSTLVALLSEDGPRQHWVPALANASALLYGSYENFTAFWGAEEGRRVNWAGFYLHPSLLSSSSSATTQLFLGPFQGRPACLAIPLSAPTRTRPLGVCATSFVSFTPLLVPDVDAYPGHIACDGVTRSELVLPVIVEGRGTVGVLDLDCEALNGFDEEDRVGLVEFVRVLVELSEWN